MSSANVKQSNACAQHRIVVNNRQLREVTNGALRALQNANRAEALPRIFQKGGILVRLRFDEKGNPAVEPLTADALRGELTRCANFFRLNEKGSVGVSPPRDVAADILNLPKWRLPRLDRIAEAPFFDSKGNLVVESGYHARAGIYLHSELCVDPVPIKPSASQAASARSLLLDELLFDFPFVEDGASAAHAVALLLQPFARQLIDGATPAYAIDAPTPGTGKTLLAELVARVATGRAAEVTPETENVQELRKALTAILLKDAAITLFDNLKERMSAAPLMAALTARTWQDRILGLSKMVSLPILTTWILTGNNLRFDGEAARRICRIGLDAGVEQPSQRTGFKHRLPEWAQKHRPALVWACLVLIQNWIATGRPLFTRRTLGTFESWAQVMGGVLEVARISGFLENLDVFHQQTDEDAEAWRTFVIAWFRKYGSQAVQAKDLIDLARGLLPGELFEDAETPQMQATRLGLSLRARISRVYCNWQIVRATARGEKAQPRPGYALSSTMRLTL